MISVRFALVFLFWRSAASEILNPGPEPEVDPTAEEFDIRFVKDETSPEGVQKNAIRDKTNLWPGKLVPYVIDGLSSKESIALTQAMQDFNQYTCIRFVQRNPLVHRNYVKFRKDGGCYSYVGMIGGQQTISLDSGCGSKGIAIHEVLHALGFYHEHNRSDRDQYITVNFDNIRSGLDDQFQKVSTNEEDRLGMPYDYDSVLHYRSTAFQKRSGLHTIVPKDMSKLNDIGQRRGFSTNDVAEVNKLYGCDTPQPTQGPAPPQPTQPKPPPQPTQPPAPPPSSTCFNTDENYCAQISQYHCGIFASLRNSYCRKRCGSCSDSVQPAVPPQPPAPPPQPACRDIAPMCRRDLYVYHCNYMYRQYCLQTCGLC